MAIEDHDIDRLFQSTLPVGGATPHKPEDLDTSMISIHAPRGGSDTWTVPDLCAYTISIHAPRGGSDWKNQKKGRINYGFQSTLPVGGATWA